MAIDSIFSVITIGAIILQIVGFMLLLKYVLKTNILDIEKWEREFKEKHKDNPRALKEIGDIQNRETRVVNTGVGFGSGSYDAPKKFWRQWDRKRKLGIWFIVIGLAIHIILIIVD